VPPEDGSALAVAIEQLLDNDQLRQQLGAQALRYAKENCDKNAVLNKLNQHLQSLTNQA
jgi:glycosyltransferase involved in cell wall biosynthesis